MRVMRRHATLATILILFFSASEAKGERFDSSWGCHCFPAPRGDRIVRPGSLAHQRRGALAK